MHAAVRAQLRGQSEFEAGVPIKHVPHLQLAPRCLVRYLVGDAVAEHLGLPADQAFQAKLAFLRLLPSMPGAAATFAMPVTPTPPNTG